MQKMVFMVNFNHRDIYEPDYCHRYELYERFLSGADWDEKNAQDVVDKNSAVFNRIKKSLNAKWFQLPKCPNGNTPLRYINPWRTISRINRIRTKLLLSQGRHEEAIESANMMIEFSNRIMNSSNCLVSSLTGIKIFEEGWLCINECLKYDAIRPENLKPYIDRWSDLEVSQETIRELYKREYRMLANTCNDMANGRTDVDDYMGSPGIVSRLRVLFLSDSNATKKLLAQIYRALIKNTYIPYSQRIDLTLLANKWEKSVIFIKNMEGKQLAVRVTVNYAFDESKFDVHKLLCRTTPVIVALKCYQLEHGDLPDSLEQLIPNYLKNVPLDPFDEKAIRYSKEKKILYSVGEDLIDSGGAKENEIIIYDYPFSRRLRAKDPTIMIEF